MSDAEVRELRNDVDELLVTLKGRGDSDGLVARFNHAEGSLDALAKSVAEIVVLLRGQADGLGLVGKMNIMWRTWVFVVGLIGAALGFVVRGMI